MRAASLCASLLLSASSALAQGQQPSYLLRLRERVERALAWVENPQISAVGFAIGDRRTVLTAGSELYSGRPFAVTPWAAPQHRAWSQRVELSTARLGARRALVLRLERELPTQPLELVPFVPGIGEPVHVLVSVGPFDAQRRRGAPALEVVRTTITAVGARTFTIAVSSSLWGPVVDAEGRLFGFHVGGGQVVLASTLVDGGASLAELETRPAPRTPVLPIFGLRLGYEHGGLLDNSILIGFEGGAALWDRLGLVLGLAFAFAGSQTTSLPPQDGLGPGVASASRFKYSLSLEARYRLLLVRTSSVYLDLASGLHLAGGGRFPQGLALFSAQPGCDPTQSACPLVAKDGEAVDNLTTTGVGPAFGADLRLSFFAIGYRFTPRALSYRMPNTHAFTLGALVF